MTTIKKNQHFWTYIDTLGIDWSYCDRCGKCYHNDHPEKLFSYRQALEIVANDPTAITQYGEPAQPLAREELKKLPGN